MSDKSPPCPPEAPNGLCINVSETLCPRCGKSLGSHDQRSPHGVFYCPAPPCSSEASAWKPPFCANLVEEVECPACGEEAVMVREKEVYFDGDHEGYCSNCHVRLELQSAVSVVFSDPEVVDG